MKTPILLTLNCLLVQLATDVDREERDSNEDPLGSFESRMRERYESHKKDLTNYFPVAIEYLSYVGDDTFDHIFDHTESLTNAGQLVADDIHT